MRGKEYTQEIDEMIADYAARGWVSYEELGVKEGSDFHKFSANLREGINNEGKLTSGPTQQAYMKACAAVGTKPKAHFGVTLNGNDATNFVKADFSEFWCTHVTQNRY